MAGALRPGVDISKPAECDTFKQLADHLYTRAEERRSMERQTRVVGLGALNRAQQSGGPLTPKLLAKLEEALSRMDIRGLIPRQPVCAIIPNNKPRPVFNELFIAMVELTKQIMPGVDLFAGRWFFQSA